MAADFNTYLSIKGTKDELKAVLGVLKKFENDSEIYLQFVEVGKGKENERKGLFDDSTRLRDLSPDEKVEKFLDSVGTELTVTAGGPYGHFGWLEETGLFEAIADAAINLSGARQKMGNCIYSINTHWMTAIPIPIMFQTYFLMRSSKVYLKSIVMIMRMITTILLKS